MQDRRWILSSIDGFWVERADPSALVWAKNKEGRSALRSNVLHPVERTAPQCVGLGEERGRKKRVEEQLAPPGWNALLPSALV